MTRRNENPTPRPRRLRPEDVSGFNISADIRVGPKTNEALLDAIKSKNAYRFWRLKGDYRWLQKQCAKAGRNPDEAHELLR